MIRELRERAGASPTSYKLALVETNGDISRAVDVQFPRTERSQVQVKDRYGFIVEVNCKTNFLSKDSTFMRSLTVFPTLRLIITGCTIYGPDGSSPSCG